MNRVIGRIMSLFLVPVLLLGTGFRAAPGEGADGTYPTSVSLGVTDIQDEAVALASAPATSNTAMPAASGTLVQKTDKAAIDYSNTADGYVMVRYSASTTVKLKAQVVGPSGTPYNYDLKAGADYVALPLSDGSGSYKVSVFENISGTTYATVTTVTVSVTLKNEFAPFLLPNQYVNYRTDSKTVQKAAELVKDKTKLLDQVGAVYDFVVNNITYDKERAATVKSGYLPVVDSVLSEQKGICFDYAALMAAMLRSQGIATKLVVGNSGAVYHAWINVYSKETGWVDGVIYFDGNTWKLMDPTFASTGKQSKQIMEYIGDGTNYTAKYIY